jgi:hypothetical protein
MSLFPARCFSTTSWRISIRTIGSTSSQTIQASSMVRKSMTMTPRSTATLSSTTKTSSTGSSRH